MSAPESDDERPNGRLLTGLFWAGVGLAPVAALVLLLGDGNGSLRFAVVLAVLAVVLIGLSIALRPNAESVRLDLEDMVLDEVDGLREDIRKDIATAAHATHKAFGEKLQVLQDNVEALRAQLDALRVEAPRAAPERAPYDRAEPTGRDREAAGAGYAAVPSAQAAVPTAHAAVPPTSVSYPAADGYAGRQAEGYAGRQAEGHAGRQAAGYAATASGTARPGSPAAGTAYPGAPTTFSAAAQPALPAAAPPAAAPHPAESGQRGGRARVPAGRVHHTETVLTTRHTVVDPHGDEHDTDGVYGGAPGYGANGAVAGYGAANGNAAGYSATNGAGTYGATGGGASGYGATGASGYGATGASGYGAAGGGAGTYGAAGGGAAGYGAANGAYGGHTAEPARGGVYGRSLEVPVVDGWASRGRRAADAGREPWEEPARHEARDEGRRSWSYDRDDAVVPADEPWSSDVRAGDRWASLRSDDNGRELRVGERRAAVRSHASGTELRVEDRWAAVRHDEPRHDAPHYDQPRHDDPRADDPRAGDPRGGEPGADRGWYGGTGDDRWGDASGAHSWSSGGGGGWERSASARALPAGGGESAGSWRQGWAEPEREPARRGRRHRDDDQDRW